MNIEVNNKTKTKIDIKLVEKVSESFLKKYKKKELELSVVFVGDRRIKTLNKIYRGYDKTTDILSFEGEGEFFGELILNYNQIKKQAKRFGNTPKKELVFILVHGLFHLLGYSDETPKEEAEMIRLGDDFIKKLDL